MILHGFTWRKNHIVSYKNIRVYTSEDAKKILNIDAKGKKVMEFELYGKNEKDRLLPEDILKQKKY